MTKKTFFLDQHGCAKNQVDAEIIISRLNEMGFVRTLDAEEASLIIINSCGFIESAKKESLDALMNARKAYPESKIILSGCLAERYADLFKEQLPEADAIFGNGDLSQIDKTVRSVMRGNRPVVKPKQLGVCCGTRNEFLSFKGSAFVKITEGCNNFCSFCAIPVIRGELRSRPAEEIIAEIKQLVKSGVYEINLIGQDLAAYGCGKTDSIFKDGINWYSVTYEDLPADSKMKLAAAKKSSPLCSLMKKISALKGNFVVRLLYIHPDHFNKDILPVMQKDKRFLPYFDIPFQSGSDNVIHAMNRTGSAEKYIQLVKDIRTALPDAAIRTTFLTGFPGETEEDALKTQDFLSKIQSDWSGCFEYSREEDTKAYSLKGRVAKKTAALRAQRLNELQHSITEKRLHERCKKTYDVLVEEIIQNTEGTDEGLAIGRAWFEAPEVDGNVVIRYDLDDKKAVEAIKEGSVVKVKAVASSELDIDGVFCGN